MIATRGCADEIAPELQHYSLQMGTAADARCSAKRPRASLFLDVALEIVAASVAFVVVIHFLLVSSKEEPGTGCRDREKEVGWMVAMILVSISHPHLTPLSDSK